jgi:hypothetical protein
VIRRQAGPSRSRCLTELPLEGFGESVLDQDVAILDSEALYSSSTER